MTALRCALTLAAAGLMAGLPADMVRVTWAIPAAGVLLLGGLWSAERRLSLRLCVAAAGFSLLPVGMITVGAVLTDGMGVSGAAYAGAYGAAMVALAWSAVIPWWGCGSDPLDRLGEGFDVRSVALALIAFTAAALVARLVGGHPFAFSIDEALYHFQAARLLDSPRGLQVEPALEPFFRVRQTFVSGGYLNGQYTPGWPALLALFQVVGLEAIAPVTVYALSLVATATLARVLGAGWETTLLTVVLTGTSFLHFDSVSSFFSHGAAGLFALVAAIFAVRATRSDGRRAVREWAGMGLFIALTGVARPLTGAVAGLVAAWWMFEHRALHLRPAFSVALGALPATAGLLAYNRVTTGNATTFGYQLAHGGLQSLGFGERGEVWFGPEGTPVSRAVDFQPIDGLAKLFSDIGLGILEFWPGGLILLLGAAAVATGRRIPWKWVLALLLLPLVHGAYFFSDTRLFVEALPFAMLGTAFAASALRSESVGVGRPAIVASLVVGAAATTGEAVAWAEMEASRLAYFHAVEEARDVHGPIVVFVAQDRPRGVGATEHGLEALFRYNGEGGAVVVGRDVPALRARVMERYPEHTPLRLLSGPENEAGHWAPPVIEPIEGR